MARRSTSLARRGPSNAQKAKRATTKLRNLRQEIQRNAPVKALIAGGLTVAGAGGTGLLRASPLTDENGEIGGIDGGVVAALVGGSVSAATGQYWLIPGFAGMAAPYASDFVEDAARGFFERGEADSPQLRAVSGD